MAASFLRQPGCWTPMLGFFGDRRPHRRRRPSSVDTKHVLDGAPYVATLPNLGVARCKVGLADANQPAAACYPLVSGGNGNSVDATPRCPFGKGPSGECVHHSEFSAFPIRSVPRSQQRHFGAPIKRFGKGYYLASRRRSVARVARAPPSMANVVPPSGTECAVAASMTISPESSPPAFGPAPVISMKSIPDTKLTV
jgi:hypothetical protein